MFGLVFAPSYACALTEAVVYGDFKGVFVVETVTERINGVV